MSNLYRPHITRYIDPQTGQRVSKSHPGAKKVKTRARKYYTKIKDASSGKWKAVPLSSRKDAAAIMAGKAHGQAALASAGIFDRFEDHRLTPLSQHLLDWWTSLISNECTAKNAAMKKSMVQKLIDHCRFVYLADLSASEIENCLAEFRKQPRFGIQTSNHYLGAAKQFSRWLYRNKRIADDPLLPLQPGNVALDRRHDRREMKDEELRLLLQATFKGPVRCRLSGPDREKLYCVAAYTGLRAAELGSLQPESFSLKSTPATVEVEAGYSKRRRKDILPVHPGLVAHIAEWIESRPPGEKLWPGGWAKGHDAGKMLKQDLQAARTAWINEAPEGPEREERAKSDFLKYQDASGRFCDFHALRHSFISRLVRSGVSPKVAQALARHSTITLTMDRYAHLELNEAVAGIAQMASLPTAKYAGCQMVAKIEVHERDMTGSIGTNHDAKSEIEPLRIAHENERFGVIRDSLIANRIGNRTTSLLTRESVLQTDPSP